MANIKEGSVQEYIMELISEGFNTKDNKEKYFRYDQKSTVDEYSSEHRQSKCNVHQKRNAWKREDNSDEL